MNDDRLMKLEHIKLLRGLINDQLMASVTEMYWLYCDDFILQIDFYRKT